jgi:hypothetical protein
MKGDLMRTPAGRTSSVRALNKVFILQTEFLAKPRARIVTSVALDGQIIHKVERTYDNKIETEEDLKASEVAVVAQHQNLANKMQANGADFIKQTRSIKISPVDRMALIPGISVVSDIDEKLAGEKPHSIYTHSKLISEIATAISASTKVGPMKLAAVIGEMGKFIISNSDNKYYLLSLRPDADIRQVLNEAIKE